MAIKYRTITVNHDNLQETIDQMHSLFNLFSRGNGTSSVWFMSREEKSGYLLIDGNIVEQEARCLANPEYQFDKITVYIL